MPRPESKKSNNYLSGHVRWYIRLHPVSAVDDGPSWAGQHPDAGQEHCPEESKYPNDAAYKCKKKADRCAEPGDGLPMLTPAIRSLRSAFPSNPTTLMQALTLNRGRQTEKESMAIREDEHSPAATARDVQPGEGGGSNTVGSCYRVGRRTGRPMKNLCAMHRQDRVG